VIFSEEVADPDDFTLLDRWRAGDNTAGQSLFQRYFESISRFFETKCEADADELVQSTFFACLRSKDQFRKESSFRTYLFTIARHELYRTLRERQRRGEHVDFEQSSIAQLVTTPGTLLDRGKEKARLLEALRDLPVAQQTLLELHYWEDMGIAELAEIFEAEAATIRQRLHRARTALREQMQGKAPPNALESLETLDTWAKGLGAPAR
jgi:RNA polymerase sigma factor (sigma-70 family)